VDLFFNRKGFSKSTNNQAKIVDSQSARFKQCLIAAVAIASLFKLYLALKTYGSPDVLGYQDYLTKIKSLGGIGAYYAGGAYDNPFNVPPLNIPVIRTMGWFTDATGLPFPFLFAPPMLLR
jgi:hypothetical protein